MADDEIVWLSAQEAASRLGIAKRTLLRLVDGGELPAYQIGRNIRLQRAEVDDFIERSRIRPGSVQVTGD